MKVAVFGGSGFLGYDFVRAALAADGIVPVVYSSSAKSLSNVARHELDIRLYPSHEPERVSLEIDIDLLVNFAHPFERRGGISGQAQVEGFARFVARARERNPRLRLIHISSMSVYEPFAPAHLFDEDAALKPPRADRYAREKVRAEQALRALPDAARWQLHLRPTVVYGPYCGVWTDRLFEAFGSGDVAYASLDGRIQPIAGADVSRFLLARLRDFRPGVYNMPGRETLRWSDFFEVFRAIVDRGRLVRDPRGAKPESGLAFYAGNLRELMHIVRREPAFDRIAVSIARHLPAQGVEFMKRLLLGRGERAPRAAAGALNRDYLRGFFGEDRLVSGARIAADFPDFAPRPLADFTAELARYHRYRYSDDSLV